MVENAFGSVVETAPCVGTAGAVTHARIKISVAKLAI
jgi:hypothetical protein